MDMFGRIIDILQIITSTLLIILLWKHLKQERKERDEEDSDE